MKYFSQPFGLLLTLVYHPRHSHRKWRSQAAIAIQPEQASRESRIEHRQQ